MTVESAGAVGAGNGAEGGAERKQLMRLVAEFESMFLLQMIKQMRSAGSWADETEKGLGSQTMMDTMDMELAGYLARAQGIGLGRQLAEGLERQFGSRERLAPPPPAPTVPVTHHVPAANDVPAAATGHLVVDPLEAAAPDPGDAPGLGAPSIDVPSGAITSRYGWRRDPFHGAARFHRGVDIRAAYGQDIPVAAPGRVVSAGAEGGYGLTVVVEHAGGLRTRYAHLSATLVHAGDELGTGQSVGLAGRSGRATGTHLHFEVTTAAGEPLDPAQFAALKAQGVVADLMGAVHSGPQETGRHDDTH